MVKLCIIKNHCFISISLNKIDLVPIPTKFGKADLSPMFKNEYQPKQNESTFKSNPKQRAQHSVTEKNTLLTSSVKVGTVLEPFTDATLRVSRKSSFDMVHLYTSRYVFALQEQTVDEYLCSHICKVVVSDKYLRNFKDRSKTHNYNLPGGWYRKYRDNVITNFRANLKEVSSVLVCPL